MNVIAVATFSILLHCSYQIQMDIPAGKYMLNTKDCGIAQVNRKIIGGTKLKHHVFPWLIHLEIFWEVGTPTNCSGSLITSQHILTAAHCLKLHEGYTFENHIDDIGLLFLQNPLPLSRKLNTVCLPIPYHNLDHLEAMLVGWGTLQDPELVLGVKGVPDLYYTTLRILSSEECESAPQIGGEFIPDKQLCAYKDATDACGGDSGGPLMINDNRRIVAVGVVSYGYGCARQGVPGGFTNVASYMNWIKEKINLPKSKYSTTRDRLRDYFIKNLVKRLYQMYY